MINVCVVGYGAVGPVHASAIVNCKYTNLYAVCDIDEEKLNTCSNLYGCKTYQDYDTLLQESSVHSVHICTPHYLHKEMAVKALRAGKNVVLEKPVAVNEKELDELLRVAENSDKKICVMLQNRTNNCVTKMYDILNNDSSTGKLVGLIGNLNWKRDESYYNNGNWRGKWDTEGGGLLINQALHLVDLMQYFGGPVKNMKSDIKRWKIENIEVEDTASALFEFENGAMGIFNATNCYITDEPYYLELKFEHRHLRYADGFLYDILEDGCNILAKDEKMKIGKSYWGCGHNTVINNFYCSLCGNEISYPTLSDAVNAMRTIYRFYDETMSCE